MSFHVEPAVIQRFDEFKIRHKFKWVMFGVDGDRHVCKEAESNMSKDVNDLIRALPETECRYVAFEYLYKSSDGRPTDKIFFITWMPRAVSNPQKMLYSTAREYLRDKCKGCIDITCGTKGEVLSEIVKSGGAVKDDDEASDNGGDWMDD